MQQSPAKAPTAADAAVQPPAIRAACKVGLYNQGATCYLNSLLQLLFHTTYFRSAVYQMSTGNDDLSSIPKALQLLFYQMQERDTAIETKVLTDTFGWDREEVMVQHDIHELITLLRENLENKMKASRVEGAINRLFTGVSEKYFRCLDGSYTSRNREEFYDIQLQVQGFSDLVASLKSLLAVEQLTGSNKYKVEEEGKPAVYKDAETGTRFLKFPPVIMCHLKRIDIDLESPNLDQKKINSLFQFPDVLDLTSMEVGLPTDDKASGSLGAGGPSPAVYDLYGVIVHRGGVRSGHYFAYMRQFLRDEKAWGEWVEYDDESVRTVDHHTAVVKNFGESITRQSVHGYPVQVLSPQNAYILAYVRREETPLVLYEEHTANIPDSVQREFKLLMKQEEEARREAEIAARRCSISFLTDDLIDKHVRLHKTDIATGREPAAPNNFQKTDSVADVIARAAQLVNVPTTNVRLWMCENRGNQSYGCGWRLMPCSPLPRGSNALSSTIAEEIGVRMGSPQPTGPWSVTLYIEMAKQVVNPIVTNVGLYGKYQATSKYQDDDEATAVRENRVFRFDPRDTAPTFTVALNRPHNVTAVAFHVSIPSKSVNSFKADMQVILKYKGVPVREPFTQRSEFSSQRPWDQLHFELVGNGLAPVLVDTIEIARRSVAMQYGGYAATADPFIISRVQIFAPPEEAQQYLAVRNPAALEFVPAKFGSVLVQVKYFNHEMDALTYAGCCMLPSTEPLGNCMPIIQNLVGASDKLKLILLEERPKTDNAAAVELSPTSFVFDSFIKTGSIIIVQQSPDTIPLIYRHPRVDGFLKTYAETRHVTVRNIATPDKVAAIVPLQLSMQYAQVVDAIGAALRLDPDFLRFYCSSSSRTPKPRDEAERSDTHARLAAMMTVQQWETNDLWYETLELSRDEIESFAAGDVAIADERGNPIEGAPPKVSFRLPNSATAFDAVRLVLREAKIPFQRPFTLLVVLEKCIKQHLVVYPDGTSGDSQSLIHPLFRQRAGRTFEVRPFVVPRDDEMTFHIAIGQYQSYPLMHGTPFLLNLPVTTTPLSVVDILLDATNTSRDELGEKYDVMMYTTAPLYFPDNAMLKSYWETTPNGSTASLLLNKKKPKEKPGSRYVSYNDPALTLEKKKGTTTAGAGRKSGGGASDGNSP